MTSIKERFWAKVKKGKGCWHWTANSYLFGYGQFWIGKKAYLAHRASYLFSRGSIPDGVCVLHRCDNPGCVNPRHLFLGTHTDNMRDKCRKGRAGRLLTIPKVKEIRRLYSTGCYSQADLGRRYGVAGELIRRIVRKESWRHID